jgi:hypothetical protein
MGRAAMEAPSRAPAPNCDQILAVSPNESGGDPIGFAAAKIRSEISIHTLSAGKLPSAKAVR